MPPIDPQKLELKSENQNVPYDPHLHEECLRALAGQRGNPAITREEDQKRTVDVIVRLKRKEDGAFQEDIPGLTIIGRIGNSDIVTGILELKGLKHVEETRKKVESLKAAKELYLDLHHSVEAVRCDPESLEKGRGRNYPGLDGSGVVIGIVDFGCDFRHMSFRKPSGATRILSLWDQSADADGQAKSPAPYGYGREITAEMINEALRTDEEDAYRILGYTPEVAAHGTHVMDIAAGNGRGTNQFGGRESNLPSSLSHPGVAPNASIIFVHLKPYEGGSLGNARNLLEAVDYIFRKADEKGLPAVINLSLSTSGGPHDGTTPVELGFEALLQEKPGRAIVVSAGNGALRQCHVSGTVPKGGTTTILWHTDPRNTDPEYSRNEMEIWYAGNQEIEVTLYAPDGKALGSVLLGETKGLYESARRSDPQRTGSARLGRVSHRKSDPNNKDNHIDIRLPHLADAPQPWKIELSSKTKNVQFHAWIEQDDRGFSRFEEPTDPNYTLGSICCGPSTLTVGAFDTAERACLAPPYEPSSAGPTRNRKPEEEIDKPDVSAPGVSILAARAHGGVTVMSGTSMAAAHVTGLVALLFQLAQRANKGPLTVETTRRIIVEAARKISGFPKAHPQLGAGRIDGAQSLDGVLDLQDAIIQPVLRALAGFGQPISSDKKDSGNGHHRNADELLVELVEKLKKADSFKLTTSPPN